jgi:TldD protein
MLRQRILLTVGLVLGGAFLASAEQSTNDVVLRALSDELARSMTLRLEGLEAPYFIQYEVSDAITYRASAAYGALSSSDRKQSRSLVSQVRVGSHTLDNANFSGGRGGGGGGRSGLGASAALPTDDDYLAIRQVVWRTTDWQFKDALETLTRKHAYLKDRNVEDRPADFTRAEPIIAVKDRVNLSFDRSRWEDDVRRISARCQEFKSIENADVALVAGVVNRYLVSSEGSRLRDGQTETLLRITLEAQSEDGQWLSDHLSFFAPTPEQLPAVEGVLTQLKALADRLGQAVKAPILEDYQGPVLFDGLAATQLFRQLLGSGITGAPDTVGTGRRSAQGGDDPDNRIGKRILPPTFQIYDDPRDAAVDGSFLAGHYLVDDEGVPAQRVNIVVDGKLEGMVMSRTPTRRFTQSNGHGRRGGAESPRAALGCLYIESNKSVSAEELKKQLIEAADQEGLKFGLRVVGLQSRSGGGGGPGGPGGRGRRGGGGGGGTRVIGDPIYVYKVFVADGHEEPVRSCEFTSVDLQGLRKILAVGKTRTVQNNVIGTTPSSSIIAPSVLMGEVELSRIKSEGERKPILAGPQTRPKLPE